MGDRSDNPSVASLASWAFVILLYASMIVGAYANAIPTVVPAVYFTASTVAFCAYAIDKSAAQNRRWRIPEKTLHLLGLMGGWPGAFLAQRILRHKTGKTGFQIIFWITVVLNCSISGWLLFGSGMGFLSR